MDPDEGRGHSRHTCLGVPVCVQTRVCVYGKSFFQSIESLFLTDLCVNLFLQDRQKQWGFYADKTVNQYDSNTTVKRIDREED